MELFEDKGIKDQLKAEELGLTEKQDRRVADFGKPDVQPTLVQKVVGVEPVKGEHTCVVDGCWNTKEKGQTYVCSQHIRSN